MNAAIPLNADQKTNTKPLPKGFTKKKFSGPKSIKSAPG